MPRGSPNQSKTGQANSKLIICYKHFVQSPSQGAINFTVVWQNRHSASTANSAWSLAVLKKHEAVFVIDMDYDKFDESLVCED